MANKKMVLAVILFVCVCLLGGLFFKDFFVTKEDGYPRNRTDLESFYQADQEIAQALERLKSNPEKANVITHGSRNQRHIALTFDGLTDRTSVWKILDLLKKHHAKATFFVDGVQTAEDPELVVNIKKEGHRVENYTLSGLSHMEKLPVERLIKDFCRAQKIIRITTDQEANLLKCNDTKYTDLLLQAAKASGFNGVVKSDAFLKAEQIDSIYAADAFVGSLKPGSIVSVKLKPNVEVIVDEPGKTDSTPAVDKQPGLKELPPPAEQKEKELIIAVERFLIALNKANYTTVYVEDFSKSKGLSKSDTGFLPEHNRKSKTGNSFALLVRMADILREEAMALFSVRTAHAADTVKRQAQEIRSISTTEPAIAYTFGGLANAAALNDVLGRLNSLGIKATFFVMEVEMQRYPDTVRLILENGHEIGLGIRPKESEGVEETSVNMIRGLTMLRDKFGVTTRLIKQPWGTVTDATKEAVAGLGCQLIGQSVNVVQSRHKEYTGADQVMAEIFGKAVFSLARGQIDHFRMDYYTNSYLIGDLVEAVKQRKIDNIAYAPFFDQPANNPANDSQYKIKPVGEILNHTAFIYQYPAAPQNIPERLREDGPRVVINRHNFLAEAAKRYIGHEYVNDEDRMIGFSKMDTRRLDQTGFVHTGDNVIFLTFDDWGTDAAVNKLLYVLRKHQVPGTFFVITNNVLNNPNLLRAIAVEGHEIGSHSDKHKPMAVRDPKTGKQVKTQDKEEYIQDLAISYQKLRAVTGDVIVNGKPALTRFFRPPTLAVSKMGFEALFATGFEYVISGSASTSDYEAENISQLVRALKAAVYTEKGEVKKGAVLVMHMSDISKYTPMALDILLTANEAKADSDPSKFKVGRLSDYIIDGYSQINRKQSLKLNRQAGDKIDD